MYDLRFDQTNISEIEFPEVISMIDEVLEGYKNYQILSVALEVDIFEEIAENGPSAPYDITEAVLVNGMFIGSILIALEDMGLLGSNKGRYFLTEPAETFLLRKSPLYQGDLILSAGYYRSGWNNLIELLHTNGSVKLKELDEFQIRSIAQQSIRGELQRVIKEIISYPGFLLSEYLLDVGGSPGLFSIALCQENHRLLASALVQEQVLPLTSSFIREYGMENRIKVESGDFKSSMLPDKRYDIVLISNFPDKYPGEIGDIMESLPHILNPGGILVLNHRFCNHHSNAKPGCGVLEIDRTLNSFGHPLCNPKDLKSIMKELGFVNITLVTHETSSGYSVLCIGTKS